MSGMKTISKLIAGGVDATRVDDGLRSRAAAELREATGAEVYPPSVSVAGPAVLALAREGREKVLLAVGQVGKGPGFASSGRQRRAFLLWRPGS